MGVSTITLLLFPSLSSALVPQDEYWSSQYGPALVSAPQAWDATVGQKHVVVAVIDTGVDIDHEDLGTIWYNADETPVGSISDPEDPPTDNDGNGYANDFHGWNFVKGTNDVYPENVGTDPLASHGTAAAGIIAASLDNYLGVGGGRWVGIAGMAQVQIMPLVAYNYQNREFDTQAIADAITYAADNGANIISMSFGGPTFYTEIEDALEYAYKSGVLLVGSSGNWNAPILVHQEDDWCSLPTGPDYELTESECLAQSGTWIDNCPTQPYGHCDVLYENSDCDGDAQFDLGTTVTDPYTLNEIHPVTDLGTIDDEILTDCTGNVGVVYPARSQYVLSVGAVGADGTRWRYSLGGAEGVLDLMSPGDEVLSTEAGTTTSPGGYWSPSGTSFAAPHVSGAAALLLVMNPSLTPAELKHILLGTATDVATENYVDVQTEGIQMVGPDPLTGWGLLDAERAVRMVADYADNDLFGAPIDVFPNQIFVHVSGAAMDIDQSGATHIAYASDEWDSLNNPNNNHQIRYSLWERNSTRLEGNTEDIWITVDNGNGNDERGPVVATSPEWTVHIAWIEDVAGAEDIYWTARHPDGDSATGGANVRLTTDGAPKGSVCIAPLSSGSSYAFWTSKPGATYDVFYAMVDSATLAVTPAGGAPLFQTTAGVNEGTMKCGSVNMPGSGEAIVLSWENIPTIQPPMPSLYWGAFDPQTNSLAYGSGPAGLPLPDTAVASGSSIETHDMTVRRYGTMWRFDIASVVSVNFPTWGVLNTIKAFRYEFDATALVLTKTLERDLYSELGAWSPSVSALEVSIDMDLEGRDYILWTNDGPYAVQFTMLSSSGFEVVPYGQTFLSEQSQSNPQFISPVVRVENDDTDDPGGWPYLDVDGRARVLWFERNHIGGEEYASRGVYATTRPMWSKQCQVSGTQYSSWPQVGDASYVITLDGKRMAAMTVFDPVYSEDVIHLFIWDNQYACPAESAADHDIIVSNPGSGDIPLYPKVLPYYDQDDLTTPYKVYLTFMTHRLLCCSDTVQVKVYSTDGSLISTYPGGIPRWEWGYGAAVHEINSETPIATLFPDTNDLHVLTGKKNVNQNLRMSYTHLNYDSQADSWTMLESFLLEDPTNQAPTFQNPGTWSLSVDQWNKPKIAVIDRPVGSQANEGDLYFVRTLLYTPGNPFGSLFVQTEQVDVSGKATLPVIAMDNVVFPAKLNPDLIGGADPYAFLRGEEQLQLGYRLGTQAAHIIWRTTIVTGQDTDYQLNYARYRVIGDPWSSPVVVQEIRNEIISRAQPTTTHMMNLQLVAITMVLDRMNRPVVAAQTDLYTPRLESPGSGSFIYPSRIHVWVIDQGAGVNDGGVWAADTAISTPVSGIWAGPSIAVDPTTNGYEIMWLDVNPNLIAKGYWFASSKTAFVEHDDILPGEERTYTGQ